MEQNDNKLICAVCNKGFSRLFTKNRHMKDAHNITIETKKKHIKCPLCSEDAMEPFCSHEDLIIHLKRMHSLEINETNIFFREMHEFESWRNQNNRCVDYVRRNKRKTAKGEVITYDCNRSNTKGFVSQCVERRVKRGGSIKISGICPSRIQATITSSGVHVHFIESHVGHEDELRSKRLTKNEQQSIAEKLAAGVTEDRILKDAKITEGAELNRLNILTRGDLAYLVRKFNIDKRRHEDDMIATILKVQEWNEQEENQVFLFKQIGESHPELHKEDFALGYMNSMMEKKLKEFSKIICVDGTHGTNRKNWDLTVVLIKDERNIGFPVAFLLSNRLDQIIQKVFFQALKTKVGENIVAKYIMTDDDVKYYNAWTQVMNVENKPRRLLCTWHVVKNWNIQGRAKLKIIENKRTMKMEMRRILNEMDISNFMDLKQKYFEHLKGQGETEFLNYLQKYYFQSEERIKMWAHCYRRNCGINTNMAIESLNKVLKYNKLRGKQNIRVEKLLDVLEELVNEKMWKKIIETERPTANSYQHRVNVEAHDKAEKVVHHFVTKLDSGEFKVKSSSVSGKCYTISYNELCDDGCRAVYCDKCKICIHMFKCDCSEYAVKTALCKHIHAVALVEKRSDSVSDGDSDNFELVISEPSTSKVHYQNEISDFLEGNVNKQNLDVPLDESRQREIMHERFCEGLKALDFATFKKHYNAFFKEEKQEDNPSKKRKMEKQSYFPGKK